MGDADEEPGRTNYLSSPAHVAATILSSLTGLGLGILLLLFMVAGPPAAVSRHYAASHWKSTVGTVVSASPVYPSWSGKDSFRLDNIRTPDFYGHLETSQAVPMPASATVGTPQPVMVYSDGYANYLNETDGYFGPTNYWTGFFVGSGVVAGILVWGFGGVFSYRLVYRRLFYFVTITRKESHPARPTIPWLIAHQLARGTQWGVNLLRLAAYMVFRHSHDLPASTYYRTLRRMQARAELLDPEQESVRALREYLPLAISKILDRDSQEAAELLTRAKDLVADAESELTARAAVAEDRQQQK